MIQDLKVKFIDKVVVPNSNIFTSILPNEMQVVTSQLPKIQLMEEKKEEPFKGLGDKIVYEDAKINQDFRE